MLHSLLIPLGEHLRDTPENSDLANSYEGDWGGKE